MKKYALFIALLLLCSAFYYMPKHYFSAAPECHAVAFTGHELSEEHQQGARGWLQERKPDDYRYFFRTFMEEEGQTYMITNFRNQEECFDVKVLVNNWDKLQGMLRTNGKSYPEELYDLQWELKTVNDREELVYVDMRKIID